MGAVYLAEHPTIGKKVAVKVIHKDLAMSRDVVDRFFQEARAVTKIGHEHIVEIHDFGETAEGDKYYIMEYLVGRTLASVLAREGRLEVIRALHVGAQIASALAAAHASGVIHRDLKPDNVMLIQRLGDPDFVKLLDFGLAKMAGGNGSGAVKTAAGVLLGTPQYMSPEACETRGIDHRTDIYALGVLLFQMLTGVLPFDGASMGEILVKQVTVLPPAPRAIVPTIPPSVEQIVLRCLMKQPDARFPTMTALREALLDPEAYLRASPPMPPARSIPPGQAPADARTVMAYAAAQQEANKTRLGTGGGLPLPAPAPSLAGAPAGPTIVAGANRAIGRVPDMVEPNPPKQNTMRIATPAGYSSRPPRRMWPIVIVIGLVLGLGGGAVAVAVFGKNRARSGAAGGSGSAAVAVAATATGVRDAGASAAGSAAIEGFRASPRPDAGSIPVTAAATATATPPVATSGSGSGSAVALATVEIDSTPPGAAVVRDGKRLGVTPLSLDLPVSSVPIELRLEHAGYQPRTEQVVVKGNVVLQLPLEPIVHHQRAHHPHPVGTDTGLMSPDDL